MQSPSSALVLLSAVALIGHVSAQLGALPSGLGGIGDDTTPVPLPPLGPPAAPTAVPLITANAQDSTDAPPPPTERVGTDVPELKVVEQPPLERLPRLCDCVTPPLTAENQIKTDDIRDISNEFCEDTSSRSSSFGLSNMVWAWGQFIDHDVVGSREEAGREDEVENIILNNPSVRPMRLTTIGPMVGDGADNKCEGQENTHTGLIDGHPVYSASEEGEETLRDGDTCLLRVTPNPGGTSGDFLPLGIDEEQDGMFLVAGDRRVNEHSVLTTMHTIWVREHNRLCGLLAENPATSDLSGDEQFEIVKATIISKMQWITVREFLPALGIRQIQLRQREQQGFDIKNAFASVEFSIAWRLGHTFIPNTLGSRQISELFRGERVFLMEGPPVVYNPDANSLIDDLVQDLATTSAKEADGTMSNALRNILFGVNTAADAATTQAQLDLCSFNIFRGRDLHIPTYAGLAECVGVTPDAATEAATPDAWLGLLMEPKRANKVLGPTIEAIVIEHFSRVLFGPDGNYFQAFNTLGRELRDKTGPFRGEIFETTMASVLSANSGVQLTGNAFMT